MVHKRRGDVRLVLEGPLELSSVALALDALAGAPLAGRSGFVAFRLEYGSD